MYYAWIELNGYQYEYNRNFHNFIKELKRQYFKPLNATSFEDARREVKEWIRTNNILAYVEKIRILSVEKDSIVPVATIKNMIDSDKQIEKARQEREIRYQEFLKLKQEFEPS